MTAPASPPAVRRSGLAARRVGNLSSIPWLWRAGSVVRVSAVLLATLAEVAIG